MIRLGGLRWAEVPASKRVIVIGGGVGGMSAAHELAKLPGYEIHLYEASRVLGGKARTQPVRGTGTEGRDDLPGEHGFRFYPRFYKHLITTMGEIPRPDGTTVEENLVETTESAVALPDGKPLRKVLRRRPSRAWDAVESIELFFADLDVDQGDVAMFALKMLEYFTSCEDRRLHRYEPITWWDFLHGDRYSQRFQDLLRSVPRTMVAMDAEYGSARTVGSICMQLVTDLATEGTDNDRTMNGPTTEVWLDPWKAHLRRAGVRIHLGKRFDRFELHGDRVKRVWFEGDASPVRGDHFVCALPIDVMHRKVTRAMAARDEALARIRSADISRLVSWMVGCQFYLYEDVPVVAGHTFYPSSPWALTSISQAQFWQGRGLFRRRYGNGDVGGVISVDVSDWFTPGTYVPKPARECSPEEIRTEVWMQLKAALNQPAAPILTDDNLFGWHLDQNVVHPRGRALENRSPHLVHPPGSWDIRPEAHNALENLYLASDYVRTHTDLASMEGANEAARRAVGALLAVDDRDDPAPAVYPLEEPATFDRLKALDRRLFEAGQPHAFQLLQLDRLYGAVALLRRVGAAVGLGRVDDILDQHRLTSILQWVFTRFGMPLPRR
jgi:uncharacterized protein with NAD-binding domain and iron-sulfur cluster